MKTKSSHTYFDFYTLTAAVEGPHLLIIAGIHGDEFEPMLTAMHLVNRLQKKLDKGKVTIIPVANVPAYNTGTRCGDDQLDLARTFPGKTGGKPTEQIAKAITELIQQADYMIDLHTGGTLFDILPLAGYLLHSDKQVLSIQQKMAQAFNLPLIWGTDETTQGRTLSVARDYKIPAIYAECRGGISVTENTISLYEEGCLRVMHMLGLIKQYVKTDLATQTWLEDYTPGQGQLQTKLPAPDEGVFVPAISLGKKVKKGTVLGYIINPLLHKETSVVVQEEGMLFMLRISGRVKKGDSLGGLIPISVNKKKVIHAK